MSYPGAEGPSGCVADFAAARAGLETATASSATWAGAGAWPEPGLTVASLLACSVYKQQGGTHVTPQKLPLSTIISLQFNPS